MEEQKNPMWPWIVGAALFITAIYLVKGILFPFMAALLVAYAMTPAVRRMEKLGLSRSLATAIMIVGFCIAIASLLFVAVPFIQTELTNLAKQVPQYGQRIWSVVGPITEELSLYVDPSDMARLRDTASGYLADVVSWGIRLIAGILTSTLAIANLISLIVVTPVVAFYVLRDWNRMTNTVDGWLPRKHAQIIRNVLKDINNTIGGFAKGQATVCVALAIYYMTMLTIVDLDFSITVGLVIGLISFVPYVGAFVGFLLSIGIALAQFSDWWSIGLVAAVFFVGQIIEGYLLVPNLVGDRIGLHPVWVIFAVLAGGVIYGFVGILIALPVAAALGVLFRYGLSYYKQSPYYLGVNNSKKPHKPKAKKA
jgi:predicted PurR-regulated permease PerM